MNRSEAQRMYAHGSSAWHTIMGGTTRWEQIPDVSLQRNQVGTALLLQVTEDDVLDRNYIDALQAAAQVALDNAVGAMREWARDAPRRDLTLTAREQREELL